MQAKSPCAVFMAMYNFWFRRICTSNGSPSFKLTFEEIQNIAGIPIDHSFLKYKKELTEYGYQVGKISMKEQTVRFFRFREVNRNIILEKDKIYRRVIVW